MRQLEHAPNLHLFNIYIHLATIYENNVRPASANYLTSFEPNGCEILESISCCTWKSPKITGAERSKHSIKRDNKTELARRELNGRAKDNNSSPARCAWEFSSLSLMKGLQLPVLLCTYLYAYIHIKRLDKYLRDSCVLNTNSNAPQGKKKTKKEN